MKRTVDHQMYFIQLFSFSLKGSLINGYFVFMCFMCGISNARITKTDKHKKRPKKIDMK